MSKLTKENKITLKGLFEELGTLDDMSSEEALNIQEKIIEYLKANPEEAAEYFHIEKEKEADRREKNKNWEKNQRVHMKGDIIITDPCYVLKDELWHDFLEKAYWRDPSTSFKWLGFKEGIIADTLYGDWGCTLFKVDNIEAAKKALVEETDYKGAKDVGGFCADAGLVAVFYLDDCLKHNKEEVEELLKKSWCAAVIKNFDGDVYIFDTKHEYEYEGKMYKDTDRHIVFEGNNNYISSQTSL